MKSVFRLAWFLLACIFLLVACGSPKAEPTAANPDQAYTQIWETVAAGQTKTAAAAPPTLDATVTNQATMTPKNTNTPLVSTTPSGDATAQPAATDTRVRPTAPSQQLCDNAAFVTDVTYSDGSDVSPGQTIVKTWRIKNLGPCEWTEEYMLTYGWGGEGTEWNKADPTHFSKNVAVGETIDVSIELVVPDEVGEYGGIFRVRNADDVYFGPTLTIYIVVK